MNNFKHIYNKVIIGAVSCLLTPVSCLLLTSCDDYLTVEPTSSISPDNFYKTEAQGDQGLMGVYNGVYQLPGALFRLSEVRSDNICNAGVDADNGEGQQVSYFGAAVADRGCVSAAWTACATVISAANLYLDNIDRVPFKTEQMHQQYVAQGRFLRALSYFYMVRLFGRVPKATYSLAGESLTTGLSPAHEIYSEIIVPDLLFCEQNLLDVATNYQNTEMKGRATRYAAKALLGEVYATMGGYPYNASDYNWSGSAAWDCTAMLSQAKTKLKEVIDYSDQNGNKWWAATITDWNKQWLHEYDNTNFIFEVQYATNADGMSTGNQVTPYTTTQSLNADSYFGGRKSQISSSLNVRVNPELVEYFLQKAQATDANNNDYFVDQRTQCTVMWRKAGGSSFSGFSGTTYVFDGSDGNCYFDKFWENKAKRDYVCAQLGTSNQWFATALNNSTSVWPQNFPLIRLENVILLYAELAGMTDGLSYLNRTRTRAGLTALTAADFASEADYVNAVLWERRIELASEGQRWFDLVRTNTFVAAIKDMFTKAATYYNDNSYLEFVNNVSQSSYVFPVPTAQRDIMGGFYN